VQLFYTPNSVLVRVFNGSLMIKQEQTLYFHEMKDKYQGLSKQLLAEVTRDLGNKRFVASVSERLLDQLLPDLLAEYQSRFNSGEPRRLNVVRASRFDFTSPKGQRPISQTESKTRPAAPAISGKLQSLFR